MKLTGKLKTQVESAATKEEKREAIKQAGMLLTDEELDQVSGGSWGTNPGGGVIWIEGEDESEKPPFISPYEQ